MPLKPYVIVFIASACGLTIEIVAGRILAPSIGVSLYTWTSIIGVVLAGISIGNYLGGRVADRFPSPTTLGLILLAGGVSSLSVLPLVEVASKAFDALPIVARIVFLTATLFLLPSLLLGMVTPVVIKLSLKDLAQTGSVVGKLYAISTSGSIFGTFVTGFVLIQWIGTRAILLLVALLLVALALAFGDLWRARLPGIALLALFAGVGAFSLFSRALDSGCLRESSYYCIRVEDTQEEGGAMVKALYLDAMVHSFNSLEDPTLLAYGYQRVFADVAAYVAERHPSPRALFVGGGGYTLPRYLEETYPESRLEVIEIDGEVTRVAHDYLGLPPETGIVTYNEDARMVVPRLPRGEYDLVVGDAFNDLSVPYHLTTLEFNELARRLLKEDGIYVVNLVDRLHTGSFLRAYVNTLRETYPYVNVLRENPSWDSDDQYTYVVAGSFRPLSLSGLREASAGAVRGQPSSYVMPEDFLKTWLDAGKVILLTDDYAPVDNLLAGRYLEIHKAPGVSEAQRHNDTGVELAGQGRLLDATVEYDEAIRLEPHRAQPYVNRGFAYNRLGEYARALQDLDEAIRLSPQLARAYVVRGESYFLLGQHQRSFLDLDEALRLEPQFVRAYQDRATSYYTLGQYQSSLQDLEEAIRLEPENPASFAIRAVVYSLLDMEAEAQRDVDRAAELGFDRSVLEAEIEEARGRR